MATVERFTEGAIPAGLARRIRSGHSLSLLLTVGTIAAAVSALRAFVVAPLTGHLTGSFEDFPGYLAAGGAVHAGTSPYAGFSASTITMSGFDYPPIVA